MQLSETGESRLRGYLYVLERSLKASPVARDIAADAVREVESHIRDQVAEIDASVDERSALENILRRLGTPATVAQGYSLELVIDEAVTTGGAVAVGRALFRLATTGIVGFFAVLGLFVGYVTGVSFLMVAVLKPVFPANVGIWMRNGIPRSVGAQFPAPAGMELVGGYWVVPAALLMGFGVLIITHLLARRWIAWIRSRLERPAFRR
jgi:uncharacterized membrane protein